MPTAALLRYGESSPGGRSVAFSGVRRNDALLPRVGTLPYERHYSCILLLRMPNADTPRRLLPTLVHGGCAHRLFRYCLLRCVRCDTSHLAARPALLRALVEVRAMAARGRPSTWRRLRLDWRWRQQRRRGATWAVRPAHLLQVGAGQAR